MTSHDRKPFPFIRNQHSNTELQTKPKAMTGNDQELTGNPAPKGAAGISGHRRNKGLSPTQRTLRALREQGLVCAIVEKWNPYGGSHGIRQDLFGIIDVLALDPQRGVVGVQSTGNDFAGHLRKLTEDRAQECLDWLSTPGTTLELWAWRKVKAQRGGKLLIWQPRVQVFTQADFQPRPENP